MRASILLCDWAEVVQGKLYAQGLGWTMIASDQALQIAVAALIRIPYDRTNKPHKAEVRLTTEDGARFPPDAPEAIFTFDFEVGRPPGMKVGQEQNLPFAAKLGGIAFPVGGYQWEFYVDGDLLDTAPFVAIPVRGIEQ